MSMESGLLVSSLEEAQRLSRLGVVDVGSNSVRLVIFDGAARSPAYFFNEKVLCELGRGLPDTGYLNPEGKVRALAALQRFQAISRGMGICPLIAVATAAMRTAKDGPEFREEIRVRTGLELRVIDGAEEARLSAQGVLLGWPDASGYVCDIGGSSMELAQVADGTIGWRQTSPLGPLELSRVATDRGAARDWIDSKLERLREQMPSAPQRLYLVGGSWRAIARIDMYRRSYPLRVLHEYRMDREELAATLDLIDNAELGQLRRATGVSADRMSLLPTAAQVLRGVLRVMKPDELFVSAYGLREGLLYEQMPEALRRTDPLLEACRYAETGAARVPGFGAELFGFIRPLFAHDGPERLRLVEAACLLHDVSWRTHPDYRAEVCFDYATRANLGGLTHADRVFLGLALLHRYKNSRSETGFEKMQTLIEPDRIAEADIVGRAMRFGAMFTLGTTGGMGRMVWDAAAKLLTLVLTPETEPLFGEVAGGRLQNLAKALQAEIRVIRPGTG